MFLFHLEMYQYRLYVNGRTLQFVWEGIQEMYFSFHYWQAVNWLKLPYKTIFSCLNEEWETEKCELDTLRYVYSSYKLPMMYKYLLFNSHCQQAALKKGFQFAE